MVTACRETLSWPRQWFELAAAANDVDAQFNLAMIYDKWVNPQDLITAFKWYERAAKNGSARAQYDLAAIYHLGRGVEPDIKAAIYWYEKAAAQGLKKAADLVGSLRD